MKLKHFNCLLIFMFSFFASVLKVDAKCSTEQYDNYRKLANQVKITYKYLEELEKEKEPRYGIFEVTISGLSPEIYVYDLTTYEEYYYKEGKPITFQTHDGPANYSINMKSSECGTYSIKKVTLDIPKFNFYSIKKVCKDIDSTKFPMCSKWYQFDVTYESITEALKGYNKTTKIVTDDNTPNGNGEKGLFDIIMDNQLYIIIGITIIFVITITIILINKRKRGALE